MTKFVPDPSSSTENAVTRPRRSRRRRWTLVIAAVVVLCGLVGPPIAARWIESQIVAHFAREGLLVEIGDLSVGLTGSLRITDFVVSDDGATLAQCARLDASIALLSLLGNSPRVRATLIDSTVLGERTVEGVRLPIVERLGRVADAMDDRTTHTWNVGFDIVDATVVILRDGKLEEFARVNVTGDLVGIPEFSEFFEPGTVGGTDGGSTSRLQAKGTLGIPLRVVQRELPGFITLATEAGTQEIEFEIEGVVRAGSMLNAVAGFAGEGSTDLPIVEVDGLRVAGPFRFQLRDGKLIGRGDLSVNGGTAPVQLDIDLKESPDARSEVRVDLDRVTLDREMAKLLRHIHPLFALARPAIDATVDGALEGRLVGDIELLHDAPLDLASFLGGWEAFPKNRLSGRGRVEVHDFTVEGSALLDRVLEWLDIEEPDSIELNPIDFTLRDGRLAYDKPVKLEIDGIETYWRGSIGLDQTIDMVWELPITSAMIEREPALRLVPGGKVALPISGTVDKPAFDLRGALSSVVGRAASGAVAEVGRDLIGGFLTGDKQADAKELLRRADRLYDEGKRDEARELYTEIRAKYRDTLTYQLNKRRIKSRRR